MNQLYEKLHENRVIESERLVLRPVELEDAQAMNQYASDPDTTYFVFSTHKDLAQTKHDLAFYFLKEPLGKYAIVEKETNQMIGTIDYHSINEATKSAELGYTLHKDYWGKGYMTEACRTLITVGFEQIGFNYLCAIHDVRNPASGRVMEKAGLQYLGVLPYHRIDNKDPLRPVDDAYYHLTKEDYFTRVEQS